MEEMFDEFRGALISEVVGRLSMSSKRDGLEALDKGYHEIVEELKNI